MKYLAETLHSLIELLEKNSIPYGVMGGMAVRAYGVPRPKYDLDVIIDIKRQRLPELFTHLRAIDYSIPEIYETGWVAEVKELKLLKLRRYLRDESLDVDYSWQSRIFQRKRLSGDAVRKPKTGQSGL